MKTNLKMSLEVSEKVQFSNPLTEVQSHQSHVACASPMLQLKPTAPSVNRVVPLSGGYVLVGVQQKINFEYRDVIFSESGFEIVTRPKWEVYAFQTVITRDQFKDLFRFPIIEPNHDLIVDAFDSSDSAELVRVCNGSWIPLSNVGSLQWEPINDFEDDQLD